MIHCAWLEPNGLIGYHQAGVPQMFLIVQGQGWVRGDAPKRTSIQAGQGVHWEQGEWHEAGTETGVIAIIIEDARFDLLRWTPLE
jgi:hypothetical protein